MCRHAALDGPALGVAVALLACVPARADITAERCGTAAAQAAVAGFSGEQSTQIDQAAWFAGGTTEDGQPASATNPVLPAHCVVSGIIGAHTGPPGDTRYGNRFKLRLPAGWNGRFVFQGGGGNNGTVGNALGPLKDGQLALVQRYAVTAQDSGHVGGAPPFALDRQAYVDFAYAGVHKAAVVSKVLLKALAGNDKGPERSYFVGCSNGGREAMVSAQRYDDFDGVVAGAPGFAVYDQWLQNMAVLRAVSAAAGTPTGAVPADTSRAYSDQQLAAVADHFMKKCDPLDGLADGIVAHPQACTASAADYEQLLCKADGGGSSNNTDCLNPVQLNGLKQMHAGLHDRSGKLVFPGFTPGAIERVMRVPYLGVPGSATPLGQFYSGVMSNFYFMGYGWQGWPGVKGPRDEVGSYPTSSVGYVAGFDFDTEPPKLAQGRLDFHGSNIDPTQPGPNFEAFKKRGGKLLLYTGTADPGVQAGGVMVFMDRLNAHYTADGAADMARLFVVPGMNHCRGGAATELFDPLATLVAWVERGQRPQRITARAVPGGVLDRALPGITRPLCAYPSVARYDGKGPAANAESFVCSAP